MASSSSFRGPGATEESGRPRLSEGELMKPRLGVGEMIIVTWPADCIMQKFGARFDVMNYDSLQTELAELGISFWMRGRARKRKPGAASTGPVYVQVFLCGPEGTVLAPYARLRNLMAERRGTKLGLPPPRKVRIFQLTNLGLVQAAQDSRAGTKEDLLEGEVQPFAAELGELSDDEELPRDGLPRERLLTTLPTGGLDKTALSMVSDADATLVSPESHPTEAALEAQFRFLQTAAVKLLMDRGGSVS